VTSDDRYQFQPLYVRAYRWLRWKPMYCIVALVSIIRWLAGGAKVDDGISLDRFEVIGNIWTCKMSSACFRMGHWYTTEEVFKELGA